MLQQLDVLLDALLDKTPGTCLIESDGADADPASGRTHGPVGAGAPHRRHAQAVAVLARAQQDAAWDKFIAHNRLRAVLHDYFPAFLNAFANKRGGIMRPEARALLAAAPTPARAARLTHVQLMNILRKAGRTRLLAEHARALQAMLCREELRQPEPVETAMGQQALALLRLLDAACRNADDLAAAAADAFATHPDAAIITSFPGIGRLTGARILAEIGDDRSRFADARGLKAYAGAAPITRASGKSRSVATRRIKNQRLAAARILLGLLRADRLTRSTCPL